MAIFHFFWPNDNDVDHNDQDGGSSDSDDGHDDDDDLAVIQSDQVYFLPQQVFAFDAETRLSRHESNQF